MGRVGLDRVPGGQGESWTELFFGNIVWTNSLMDRVCNELSWFG